MKFNPDITKAPKNRGLLLQYDLMPYPLTGVLRDDFQGGIALALPSFEIRPGDDDEAEMQEFNDDPESWLWRLSQDSDVLNEFININPNEYSLVIPPKQWKLQGWAEVWENEATN